MSQPRFTYTDAQNEFAPALIDWRVYDSGQFQRELDAIQHEREAEAYRQTIDDFLVGGRV
jgi:hypothetical protein